MNNDIFLTEMGKRIFERRKELKMTQESVAEAVNLSLQSISCIELGKKAIRPENLVKLCRVLNVSTDYILNGTRSRDELNGILKELSCLSKKDYLLVEELIRRLSKNDND